MKSLVLLAALFSAPAFAIGYEEAYQDILGKYCNSRITYIGDTGAKRVAEEASKGNIAFHAFKEAFARNCSFDSAMEIGRDVQQRRLHFRTYLDTLALYCNSRISYISDTGAKMIAREVAENNADAGAFKAAFARNCSFDSAMDVARGVKSNTMSLAAFEASISKYCNSRISYIGDTGAKRVAAEVASRSIDQETFLGVFSRTCSFDSAMEVAQDVKRGKLDLEAYESVLGTYCNSRISYISDTGAKTVGREVAQGRLNLGAFSRAFARNCNFDSAMEVGRNSVPPQPAQRSKSGTAKPGPDDADAGSAE